jgi:hypothetical protein
MITALIVRDNIGGMAREIDLLKARHKNAFDEIAKRAWCTALRGLNQHRQKIRVSVQEIFNARKESDVVAILNLRTKWSSECSGRRPWVHY